MVPWPNNVVPQRYSEEYDQDESEDTSDDAACEYRVLLFSGVPIHGVWFSCNSTVAGVGWLGERSGQFVVGLVEDAAGGAEDEVVR